jgi:cysteinyl-tRNA synthetase
MMIICLIESNFSEGGNFSADEIDAHKKRLEKMASLIDTNETSMLKEMEKLEKKHLDDAVKIIAAFQERFKFHLVDLQFIEKISRWLNDAQVKIKTEVNASNGRAKHLHVCVDEFQFKCEKFEQINMEKNVSSIILK